MGEDCDVRVRLTGTYCVPDGQAGFIVLPGVGRLDGHRTGNLSVIRGKSSRIFGDVVRRIDQFVLIASIGLGSWLGMQLVHEAGHVIGAWTTGGRVERVVLNPLTISRTDVAENSHRLVVVWAGPLFGATAPLVTWLLAASVHFAGTYLLRFFAGFCLIANGLYLGAGSFAGVGDCGELLKNGSSAWQLWLFGVATVPVGVWLWHGQGERFGLGVANGKVSRTAAYSCMVVCLVLIGFGFFIGGE